jgi:hypothetical protein
MRRPSFPTVISLIALFVALGGTSYAVIKLPANSVGSRQLKANAVSGSKIRNGSVGVGDLETAARGLRGPRGPAGPAGSAGGSGGGTAVSVEAWQPLVPAPGWSNLGGVYEPAAYRKDSLGRVFLRGVLTKNGLPAVGDVLATLPPGYRPPGRLIFSVGAGGGVNEIGRLDVSETGTIEFENGAVMETDFASLDTISFWTD